MRLLRCLAVLLVFQGHPATAGIEPDDAAEILNYLLDMQSAAHRRIDVQGESVYDTLKAYQAWQALYVKYAQLDVDPAGFREDDLRIYLLIGMVARLKLDAAISEAFTSDLMGIYENHPELTLGILKQLPFLIPSTCRYLNAYFGFEDRNSDRKPQFLKENAERIERALAPADAQRCLGYFD